ncbi:MAG: DoxX family membrane protein [Kiritimatiellae bacterium]|nr:DoxX family membrane protein [Kiritimatiellia bacterium]
MKGSCACFDCRSAAVALVRWGLGLLFLIGGINKLMHLGGFVNAYLLPAFANTYLPAGLVAAYGYALPFVEVLLGVALVLGLCRNSALFVTGLTLISLAFGQILLQKFDVVSQILVYLAMTGAVLFLGDYDRWVVGCSCKSSEPKS